MGNAGRVLMIPKGDYNPATPYEMLDCVYYNGRSYVCKQASTGHAPTDIMYWQPMTPDSSAEIQALTNQLTDEVTTRSALGAHNLLRVDLALCKADTDNNGTWASNVYSKNSVDITVYDDGQIKINGTPSATFAFLTGKQPIGNIASGMKYSSGGASTSGKYVGAIDYYNASSQYISQQILTDGVALTIPSNCAYFRYSVVLYKDQSADNVVFKSMLRLATDSDPTYQPYAKTNVELTEMTAISIGTATAGSHVGNTPVYTQFGKMVVVNLLLNVNGAVANDEALLTNLPQCGSSGGRNTVIGDSSGNNARVRIASNGTSIISEGGIANTGWYSGQLIYFTD